MKSLRILTLADSGIGGTEKAATIYACGLKQAGHFVVYSGEKGPRTAELELNEIPVVTAARTPSAMREMILDIKPDIIHQHIPGYPCNNPIYDALVGMSQRPKLIQTNVFGWLSEKRAIEMVDFHLFISRASGSQAFRRAGLKLNQEWLRKCSVVMYPLPQSKQVDPEFRREYRKQRGISDDTCLAIRVGRPSMGKWTDWECKALLHAVELGAKVKLLIIEPPAALLPRLQKAIDRNLIIIEKATADFDLLNAYYSAADCMLHASLFGESFGYTLAEGMAAGLPVITRSTPWGDSAQVELVENGVTGHVCATTQEMGRRLFDLARGAATAKEMGKAGKQRIEELSDSEREINLLEKILIHLTTGSAQTAIEQRNNEFLSFHEQLPQREKAYSDTRRPLLELVHWNCYKAYRELRAWLRVNLKQ